MKKKRRQPDADDAIGEKPLSPMVEALAGYGLPACDIATVLDMDADVIRGEYQAELETGLTMARTRVAERLFHTATGEGREAVRAAIFWLKTRAGWKETSFLGHTGMINTPVTIETTCEKCIEVGDATEQP